ncbi:MAG TPA: ThuA domain-containing protein, partial [Pedobacter sp.]
NKRLTYSVICVSIISLFSFSRWTPVDKPIRLLVFSKTSGFRHGSIEHGKAAIMKLGEENGYRVDTTENSEYFVDDSLKNYSAVIFLNTTMNVLNPAQETGFKRYIQAGGGYVGIHAASDTEYDWTWYGKLVGAYFAGHPAQQDAIINVIDKGNISTSHLPEKWKRFDEWYNYKNINPDIKVVLSLDEKSYKGGTNGDNHPIAWYHEFDGGRAFYTGLGHTDQSYTEPLFLKHLLGGIKYAIGNNTLVYGKVSTPPVPENDRFVKTVLTTEPLFEPTELGVLPNLDIIVVQRRGEMLYYDGQTKKLTPAGTINVYHNTGLPKVNAEEGLLGVAIDPNFKKNNHIFVFYSPSDTSVNRLSRFTLKNKKLDMASEKVLLQFYSQRQICCHTGGSIAFGPDGLLYVSTGDNSTPFDVPNQPIANHGFAPLDNREGNKQWDARRSAGNTNDLRGKILRIRVKEDGSYEIPKGNLFPENTPRTKPEIYVMGNRNPYRISVDQKTGFLYWGEIGPDARADSASRGPRGYDEVNQARRAGYFGWPFFVANNQAYRAYDYKTATPGAFFDPAKPVNDSERNTGLNELPPAQPAFIWYSYGPSQEFPEVGESGRSAMTGPIYYSDLYPKPTRYPDHFNGKLLIYDWMRGWLKAVSMKSNGDYLGMEPFADALSFSSPIDIEVGPDGRFYVLEYGKGWFTSNQDAVISRIDYLSGNRPPKINELIIKKTSGLLPYRLTAKVDATDPDKDNLTYVWNLGKGIIKTTKEPSLQYTFTKAGTYLVYVTVIDNNKASSRSSAINVTAGNEQPQVDILVKGNRSFYFPGKPVDYQVVVTDKGSAVNKKNIFVSSSITEGTDLASAPMGHQEVQQTYPGQALMLKSDCKSCHGVNTKSVGPSFTEISKKYKHVFNPKLHLVTKIIKGGAGVWGDVPMPSHTNLKEEDVSKMVDWILSLNAQPDAKASLPLSGRQTPAEANKTFGKNTFNIKASYFDLGSNGAKSLSNSYNLVLRSNYIEAGKIKNRTNFSRKDSSGYDFLIAPSGKGVLRFNKIDLTDIKGLNIHITGQGAESEYNIEVRLGSDNGSVIGTGTLQSNNQIADNKFNVLLKPVTDRKEHNVSIIFTQVNPIKKRPLIRWVEFISQ